MPQQPHSLWVQTAHVCKPRAFMWLSVVHVLAVGLDLSVSPDLTQCTWAFVPCIRLFDKWRCTESIMHVHTVWSEVTRPAGVPNSKQSNPYIQHITHCSCLLHSSSMYPCTYSSTQRIAMHKTCQTTFGKTNPFPNRMQVGRRGGVHAHGSLRIGVQVRRDSTRSSQIGGHRSGLPFKPPTRSKIGRTKTGF
jgi:hypothetical protein